MPAKFGYISKAYVTQDYLVANDTDRQNFINNNPLALSIYILSTNLDGKLTRASTVVKQNLKTYLSYNKMMSDAILIKDAYFVNIKVNFDITVLPAYNSQDVLTRCINTLKDYFDTSKWQINQPIIISDVYNTIGAIQGVQSVIKVSFDNLTGGNYSSYSYNISSATKQGVIYPSLDPMMFEVRFPDIDIYGRVVTY
jgi:phage-related baseplate assembly protein